MTHYIGKEFLLSIIIRKKLKEHDLLVHLEEFDSIFF